MASFGPQYLIEILSEIMISIGIFESYSKHFYVIKQLLKGGILLLPFVICRVIPVFKNKRRLRDASTGILRKIRDFQY